MKGDEYMFIEQINVLTGKENAILAEIDDLENDLKQLRDTLAVVRKGLKSMQRLQDQLCGASEEEPCVNAV